MTPGSGTVLVGGAVPGAISGLHIVTQSPVQTTFVPCSGTKKYSVNPFASTRIWPSAGLVAADRTGLAGVGVAFGAAVAPPHAATDSVARTSTIPFTADPPGEPVAADFLPCCPSSPTLEAPRAPWL